MKKILSNNQASVGDLDGQKYQHNIVIDKLSSWFVPTVIIISLIAFSVWSIFGPPPALAKGLVAAVSVLIIACPCALDLTTCSG